MNKAIEEYSKIRPLYYSYTERIKDLVAELLQLNDIKIHLIEGRAKSVESYSEKINRPGKSYKNPIKELSDLSGIRVIVYYQDDVNKVAEVLRQELDIVESEVSHQPNKYSPDQFGYISLHYVIQLDNARTKLPEWKVYSSFRAEIQIRTVLQHSWAAVSHALQYKHESDAPKQLRRKLFRLAGLFELADEEFVSVRKTTFDVRNNAAHAIKNGDNTLLIDALSLQEFISQWNDLAAIKSYMRHIGYKFEYDEGYEDDVDYFGSIAFHCERIGIENIGQLKDALNRDFKRYLKIISSNKAWHVSDSFTLYLLLIRSKIENFTTMDLVNTEWDKSISERVIQGAIKDSQEEANKGTQPSTEPIT
ncbi:hypothetical protein [Microbulbifer sp. VAAF005]|uniref:GTP pyrophosphokinase n=1 Tax=Microbulbifer sp. VAAF005 TaxID=3034230 RepID=UPI0024ADD0B9|nr:hypothetical protein [Microbulbifer sp. VAAF005]WHI44670.1 hypothetical protein P0078_13030 [Microbulbifer sp. VAAF005]